MYIRKSNREDLPAMMEIYARARDFMRESGNPGQWEDNYPPQDLLEKDIEYGNSYVVCDDNKIIATFAFASNSII